MKTKLLVCVLSLGAILLLTGCLGPKPVVESFQTEPPPLGADLPYKVTAVVSNQGPGEGAVRVVVKLVDKQTKETLGEDAKQIQLSVGEKQAVNFEINLAQSARHTDRSQIDVQVAAEYPIE